MQETSSMMIKSAFLIICVCFESNKSVDAEFSIQGMGYPNQEYVVPPKMSKIADFPVSDVANTI